MRPCWATDHRTVPYSRSDDYAEPVRYLSTDLTLNSHIAQLPIRRCRLSSDFELELSFLYRIAPNKYFTSCVSLRGLSNKMSSFQPPGEEYAIVLAITDNAFSD